MNDWQDDLDNLARELISAGKLRSPRWIEVFKAVPRHVFVPRFWQQDPTGWHEIDTSTAEGWAAVYSNRGLFTAVDSNGLGVSSSSTPGLMSRMLEALDLAPGHRVLEIGTGTGYNAALLCEYLGSEQVHSLDIEFVADAETRLASLGYKPTLAVRDGRSGLPEQAPFDRIIATCAVPTIPLSWVEQLAEGGAILTDLKVGVGAGNLVLLHRHGDRAEGRFDPGWADFMLMRNGDASRSDVPHSPAPESLSTTHLPAQPWRQTVPWFLAAFRLPPGTRYGMQVNDGITWWTVTSPDGSRAAASSTEVNGHREVAQAGPTRLWDAIEQAFCEWEEAGQPGWSRFGLTVGHDAQTVWLDDPTSGRTWTLLGD